MIREKTDNEYHKWWYVMPKKVMRWCQNGKYHNEGWEMRPEYVCQV